MIKTEAIKRFLTERAPGDLAELYTGDMEVQVNVAQDNGQRYDGEYRGKQFTAWTDGEQTWKSFRIPWNAATKPEYSDRPIGFDLAAHAEAIGMTGWNWRQRQSLWVAYDFDSIVNHQEGLSADDLRGVYEAACAVPWVTVRVSTSGSGYHLYVFLEPVATENHTEHAALARAILAKMSGIVGFDFQSRVDACGGNIWVWHRKYEITNGIGLSIVKQGEKLTEIPVNWRDHLSVTSRKTAKPKWSSEEGFEEVCGRYVSVPLDDTHKLIMKSIEETGGMCWWDSDRHMFVCHTADLRTVHEKLGLRGVFQTVATGAEHGADQNAFAFPQPDGAWVIRRHTRDVAEAPTWDKDSSGWTRCYYNRAPDFTTAMIAGGALEDEKGDHVFTSVGQARKALSSLGRPVDLPPQFEGRNITVHNNGAKLIISSPKADIDGLIPGWLPKGKKWIKVVEGPDGEVESIGYDDTVRHLVAESNTDAGWVLRTDNTGWIEEPLTHVKMGLKSMGHSAKEVDHIMGQGIVNRWRLTNTPFKPEYPGDKVWNRDGVQFAVTPSLKDDYEFPTWDRVLSHCGSSLDQAVKENEWCKANGLLVGSDYLKLWIASMFQEPDQPLPYLFFYGPQGSGKSIFHEAISLLMTGGVARADSALLSPSGFNGELASAVLCVIEETDLRKDKAQAYNRIKDWTTGESISIHTKGNTPYTARNYTHWVQMSNDMESCPVFPGDTRITMVCVDMLPGDQYIAKKELLAKLREEAPDFLAFLLAMVVPKTNDRFPVPVLTTMDKLIAESVGKNELEQFIEESCFETPGYGMKWSDFTDAFREWLDPERRFLWSKRRIGQLLPKRYVKGRWMSDGAHYWVGNLSLTHPGEMDFPAPCFMEGEKIMNLKGTL